MLVNKLTSHFQLFSDWHHNKQKIIISALRNWQIFPQNKIIEGFRANKFWGEKKKQLNFFMIFKLSDFGNHSFNLSTTGILRIFFRIPSNQSISFSITSVGFSNIFFWKNQILKCCLDSKVNLDAAHFVCL